MIENNKKGLLVGYVRVSTIEQNPQLQVDALVKEGVDQRHIFQDSKSGATTKRIALQEMFEFIKEGDTIVVWKLDRLARSLSDLINIMNLLKEKKIGLKSLTEHLDTTTPNGMLLFHLFGSIAQFEREIIRERSLAGMEAARLRGVFGGRRKALSETQVSAAKMLKSEGKTAIQIAEALNTSRSTIYRALSCV
jgi:DNA invertase Pin-like site-specific DNA recombinase